jgi:ElaA protein
MDFIIKHTNDLTPKELVAIFKARTAVFVVEQNCPYQEVDDKDFDATHVQLQVDGQLAAYTRLIPHADGEHMSIGRVLTVERFRGNQYARQIMTRSIEEIYSRYPSKDIKIGAQAYLIDFYQSLGFESVSDIYLEDDIPHIDMVYRYVF